VVKICKQGSPAIEAMEIVYRPAKMILSLFQEIAACVAVGVKSRIAWDIKLDMRVCVWARVHRRRVQKAKENMPVPVNSL
jgi:hypothetical protein